MKLVRFEYNSEIKWGVITGEQINFIKGNIFDEYIITDEAVQVSKVALFAPCEPTKAVCVGLNYYDHAKEMNLQIPKEPLLFIKPSSALTAPGGSIIYPTITNNLHYEAELAIVIKKNAKDVAVEDAYNYILGYTCANDVSARDLQMNDIQWTRGKSFDTFMPIGPCVETDINPHDINISLYLNDELKQSSNTKNLIFSVPEIIAHISQVMTLYPGDVILTGTPAGVGPMKAGDTVRVELEGIGSLMNIVEKK